MWFLLILVALLCCAVFFDVRSHRIPNWLVAAGLVCGFSLNSLLSAGLGFISALQGLGLGILLLLPLYLLRAMGAGDVKLMGMVGAFLGPKAIVGVTLLTFIAGGVLALLMALRTGQLKYMLGNVRMVIQGAAMQAALRQKPDIEVPQSAGKLPYAVAIAAGTFLFLVWQRM
ncbi:MAG: A24 family peptidase [Gallionella sp.]|nr:A24 family peptidase [Gallionella sp.]